MTARFRPGDRIPWGVNTEGSPNELVVASVSALGNVRVYEHNLDDAVWLPASWLPDPLSREPEYEPGSAWVSALGIAYLRTQGGGWRHMYGSDLTHEAPDRPLTRLVPEGSERDAIRARVADLLVPGTGLYADGHRAAIRDALNAIGGES